MKTPFIILDRDGVINEEDANYIKCLAEWIPIPGSLDAIAALSQSGYRIFIITNQSGIGRGYYHETDLAEIHQHLIHEVERRGGQIDGIYHCPHTPKANCQCRKPATGLFLELQQDHQLALNNAIYVGDKITDLQAGDGAGAHSVLLKTGDGQTTLSQLPDNHTYPVFSHLNELANAILTQQFTWGDPTLS